jgi:hypothetical protein
MSQSMQTMPMFACDSCWLSGTLIVLYHKCMPIVLQMKHISAVFGFDLGGLPAAVTVPRAAHLTPMPGHWSAWESSQPCAAPLRKLPSTLNIWILVLPSSLRPLCTQDCEHLYFFHVVDWTCNFAILNLYPLLSLSNSQILSRQSSNSSMNEKRPSRNIAMTIGSC